MNSLEYALFDGAYSISVDTSQYNAGDRIYLPDTPVLANKKITGLFVFGLALQEPNTQDPDGNVITNSNIGQFYLTLVDKENVDFISNVPLFYFMYGGRQIPINKELVLPNCYLIKQSTAATQNIFITFFYSTTDQKNVVKVNPLVLKIQSMSIPVESSSFNRYYLSDNRILVDKKFKNIYSNISTGQVNSPDGNVIVSPMNTFLTLIHGSDIVLYRLPVLYLSQWNSPFRLRMNNIQADLPTSYIELSQNVAQSVGNKTVFLNFEYTD